MEEPILIVPRRLTSDLYRALADALLVPRRWHLAGRYGSRTHAITTTPPHPESADERDDASHMGFPVLESAVPVISSWLIECRQINPHPPRFDHSSLPSWQKILASNALCVALERRKVEERNHPALETVDATVHPERAPKLPCSAKSIQRPSCSFTFVELFAGIGGFAMGLEALGGKCVFASEIEPACHSMYRANVSLPSDSSEHMAGDIYKVPSEAVPYHDLLVAGFPCQPFSSLGDQRGLEDFTVSAGNRGLLFLQIVRILMAKRPKAFLLENVPGLLATDEGRALSAIRTALECDGVYFVTEEVISSRALTAQSRKRLFFVGLQRQSSENKNAAAVSDHFEFPYMPDLGLRAVDVLENDDEVRNSSDRDLYDLTDDQFQMLLTRKKSKWKPARLAWPDTVCDTVDGHYGISVGRGGSQLVPCAAPRPPRKFTIRECSRLMGFSSKYFRVPSPKSGNELRSLYLMMGNAVCPPVVAALGGAILDHILPSVGEGFDAGTGGRYWVQYGRLVSIQLALDAIRPDRKAIVTARLRDVLGDAFIE